MVLYTQHIGKMLDIAVVSYLDFPLGRLVGLST